MFGFGLELRRPNTQELTKDRHICKGNVLSRRKAIEQVEKEELRRLVLPAIHKSRSNDISSRCGATKTKGFIRRGYTFDRSKLKADERDNSLSLDEDDVEQLLLLKSLNSFNNDGKDENHQIGKYLNPRRSSEECERKSRREDNSRGDNDSGFSDSSANQDDLSSSEKQPKNNAYFRENSRDYTTLHRRSSFSDSLLSSRLVVRKAVQIDAGATMCTQSLNSLCTDLAMFKDAISRGLQGTDFDGPRNPHCLLKAVDKKETSMPYVVDDTRESNTRSSSTESESLSSISAAADSTFAVFKKKRKNLLSRTQKSRESRSSSESPLSSPGEEVKYHHVSPSSSLPCATEIHSNETCRKTSVVSETVDGCCTCVIPPRVQVALKNDHVVNSERLNTFAKKKEFKMPTKYYDCYTPVTSKVVQFGIDKRTTRAPFKIDSKVATMQRALAEFKERKPPKILQSRQQTRKLNNQSVLSDPEISPRKKTTIKATSHEWPPQMKLSDDEDRVEERPSLASDGRTLWIVNSKCDEWLNRWIRGNHGE